MSNELKDYLDLKQELEQLTKKKIKLEIEIKQLEKEIGPNPMSISKIEEKISSLTDFLKKDMKEWENQYGKRFA